MHKNKAVRNLEDFAGIASDWFWETDAEHRFTYFSRRMEEVTKLDASRILGTRRTNVGKFDAGDPMWRAHLEDLYAHRAFRNFEYQLRRPTDGSVMWLRVAGQPLFDPNGKFIGYRGTGHDITAEKEAMNRLEAANIALAQRNEELAEARSALERSVFEEPLTGVLNRRAFERDLAAATAKGGGQIGLLHVDLDRFKLVNDTLGHRAGDVVLKVASERIGNAIGDQGHLYRIGGDEFMVILLHDNAEEMCRWIGETIIEHVATPISYEGTTTSVGASVGMAVGVSGHCLPDDLVMQADVALYAAKRDGRSTLRRITPQMQSTMQDSRQLASEIPHAIARGEFIAYFQPQVHVGTGTVVGAEALARWAHPTRGLLQPDQFLGVASHWGLTTSIDRAVMQTALTTAAELRRQGVALPSVSVNMSAARLMDPKLCDEVDALWKDRNCKLCIELLETIYYDDAGESPLIFQNLKKLRDMGVQIEVDDFGSGRASITGLLTVRPDRLKIDRALVRAAVTDPVKRNVIAAILEMSRALGMEAIAEGTETQEELDTIRALGCNIFQGFAISKPLSVGDLLQFLNNRYVLPQKKKASG